MGVSQQSTSSEPAVGKLLGQRLGPYNSFNPVTAVQIWQWCAAMGESSPLYLDSAYIEQTEFKGSAAVAPPAMMQMWTMRDVNDSYAPGSTTAHPYPIMRELEQAGFPANVAISYDIQFHRYLVAGDKAHHYKTVVDISELKSTALGEGYFFTDRMEYLDQHGELYAEALVTYFQYRPREHTAGASGESRGASRSASRSESLNPVVQPPQSVAACSPAARVGDALPVWQLPITHSLIVAGAIASQDFVKVHHNAELARAAGMPDIFMNILTTCGLVARYLGDWAGPASRLRRLQFRLMTPNTPGQTMSLTGAVSAVNAGAAGTEIDIEFSGTNSLGPHVMGSARLALPG